MAHAFAPLPAEGVSPLDAVWLRLDRPTNLMVVNGVLQFERSIDYARLLDHVHARLVSQYPRFRRRLVKPARPWQKLQWIDDEDFDIRHHVKHVVLPEPGDVAAMRRLIEARVVEPLCLTRPLWKFYMLEGRQGTNALLARVHHGVADGIALIQVLLSLTDRIWENDSLQAGAMPVSQKIAAGGKGTGAHSRAVDAAQASRVPTTARLGPAPFVWPPITPGQWWNLARWTGASLWSLAYLLLLSPDRANPFRGELGVEKGVAWTPPFALDEVKRIGRAAGATVNDVLLAAVAGAIRQTWPAKEANQAGEHNAAPKQPRDLRVVMPLNVRKQASAAELGNRFGLAFLALPVEKDSAAARLQAVKARMDRLKRSADPLVAYALLQVLGILPVRLSAALIHWFTNKASVVLTNVPGPQIPLMFAGDMLRRLVFWVPQSGSLGIGISIVSYNQEIVVGVVADRKILPDPAAFVHAFSTEVAALRKVAFARDASASATDLSGK